MNRLSLFRLISVIHAVKCKKTAAEEEANASFNMLLELKDGLGNATSEEQFTTIRQRAFTWASEPPIATDRDINDLLNQ